jgi:Ca2+-binding RTX toxin-like protein
MSRRRHVLAGGFPLLWVSLIAFLLLIPASAEARAKCLGKPATIVGSAGDDRITGRKAPDVIVTKGGNDTINGYKGNDRICGGSGNDTINGFRGVDRLSGDDGDDTINGEKGTDYLIGGIGADTLIGDSGSDQLDGGPGDGDRLTGDRGNDILLGGEGERDLLDGSLGDDTGDGGPGNADRVIGGLGIDKLTGGDGDGDVIRGEGADDAISGGPGRQDIASFALASPPGAGTFDGVIVNLASGTAEGDGQDAISGGIEDVAGSPFRDHLIGDRGDNRLDGGPGDDTLEGGGGSDTAFGGSGNNVCQGFSSLESCNGQSPPVSGGGGTTVDLSRGIDGGTLAIVGSANSNAVSISVNGSAYVVDDSASGVAAVAPNCNLAGGSASCSAPEQLNAISVSFGGGSDSLTVAAGVSPTVPVRADGGTGDDRLSGGAGPDTLEAGAGGNDALNGGGGGDGLISGPGADQLDGGDGSDLLVADSPCGGHVLGGGAGIDNASFAGSPIAVIATVGGTAAGLNGNCDPDRLVGTERIEGSEFGDVLIGDSGSNGFLGRRGDDLIKGMGGADILDGVEGSDTMFGGKGVDSITATDGQRDVRIDCGPGVNRKETAARDSVDPKAISC